MRRCALLLLLTLPFTSANFLTSFLDDDTCSGTVNVPFGDIEATDPNKLYNKVIETREKVANLTERINSLNFTIENETLVAQADMLLERLGAINDSIHDVSTKFAELNNNVTALKLTSIIDYYSSVLSCFATSKCITDLPTTVITTPVAIVCDPSTLNSSETETELKSPDYPNGINDYNCTQLITAPVGLYVSVKVSVKITGTARLAIIDYISGKSIQSYEADHDDAQSINYKTNTLEIYSFAGTAENDGIHFDIAYKSVEACENVECGNGTCTVDATNKATCVCNLCWSLNSTTSQCTDQKDPCKTYKYCYTDINPKNKCEVNPAATSCVASCLCDGGDGTYKKTCPKS